VLNEFDLLADLQNENHVKSEKGVGLTSSLFPSFLQQSLHLQSGKTQGDSKDNQKIKQALVHTIVSKRAKLQQLY